MQTAVDVDQEDNMKLSDLVRRISKSSGERVEASNAENDDEESTKCPGFQEHERSDRATTKWTMDFLTNRQEVELQSGGFGILELVDGGSNEAGPSGSTCGPKGDDNTNVDREKRKQVMNYDERYRSNKSPHRLFFLTDILHAIPIEVTRFQSMEASKKGRRG
ncbi:hypothetical protein L6452_06422 [Arctium lappa]|uniref:Uncharacterized protein n=1 Tax=Arctium lappa TaxID=4217 RepID=A0ACB9EJ55_ARCLA|nr:hypothetical protein L6452_06422 [Arctium lappa]